MISVTSEIYETIVDNDMKLKQVAQQIGASKQTMSKFKSSGSIGFRYLLKMSYLLFPNNPEIKMSEWCMRLDSVESIKQSFEYAAITRNIPLLKNLITKHSKEEGTIKEYVATYRIIYKYMVNEIKGIELEKEMSKIPTKDSAVSILALIYKCYQCYFESKFLLVVELAQTIGEKLKRLNDRRELFLKECFLHRLAEILAPIYLHLNNLVLARHYASIIIHANICAKTKSDAFYTLGMSYLLEDETKCLDSLRQSYEIMTTVGDAALEKESKLNLDFSKVFYGNDLEKDAHPSLLALQQFKSGKKTFLEIEEVLYQGADDDFIIFYKAISLNSVDALYDCHEYFFNQHNLFFASIVAKELIKAGENSRAVRNLMKYKIEQKGEVHFEKEFISCFSRFSIGDGINCG